MKRVTDAGLMTDATRALHSLSTHAIGIESVFILHWLKDPGEMLLMQGRWDVIYHDEERTEKAFSHHAGQWQFYKNGRYLHTIAESKIQYDTCDPQTGLFRGRTLLPEGYQDTTFFVDARRKPFAALPARQQQFVRGYHMLYISPRFSFDAARRK